MTEEAPQRDYNFLEVYDGLCRLVWAGASWQMIPHDLPPWWFTSKPSAGSQSRDI
jgi:transposase